MLPFAWLLTVALAAAAQPALRLVEVRDDGAASGTALFMRVGEERKLAIVIVDGMRCFASPPVQIGGRPCEPLPSNVQASLRWFEARPEARDYDNLASCSPFALTHGCHAPIAYSLEPVPALSGEALVAVGDRPELRMLGTHRVGATAMWHGAPLGSAPDLADGVVTDEAAMHFLQVVVRRDDSYVGYVTELLGTPFVYSPAILENGRHQTDERLGADCAALAVYGRRRMGDAVYYVAPPGLRTYAEPVRGPVREGDILHFGYQTAVLSVDRPPLGELDPTDLVIHTYHGVAEEVPLGVLPYRGSAVEILRWRSAGSGSRGSVAP